eukprot:TRINITY_DN50295_c0_g1_i1.p1 TRINITY_DN50295_c0_g1~~TRINITY_DN50295_c0_g1_i1.p1  ORF type:complete len:184 (+),score=60.37 TRINITY_DN50295_c0_g1_i1:79-630(+)
MGRGKESTERRRSLTAQPDTTLEFLTKAETLIMEQLGLSLKKSNIKQVQRMWAIWRDVKRCAQAQGNIKDKNDTIRSLQMKVLEACEHVDELKALATQKEAAARHAMEAMEAEFMKMHDQLCHEHDYVESLELTVADKDREIRLMKEQLDSMQREKGELQDTVVALRAEAKNAVRHMTHNVQQ